MGRNSQGKLVIFDKKDIIKLDKEEQEEVLMEAMDIFNVVCGACSVIGLLVSIFTASKVIKISQTFNCNNKDDHSKVTNGGKNNTYHGTYTGRDYINGTRENSEQK